MINSLHTKPNLFFLMSAFCLLPFSLKTFSKSIPDQQIHKLIRSSNLSFKSPNSDSNYFQKMEIKLQHVKSYYLKIESEKKWTNITKIKNNLQVGDSAITIIHIKNNLQKQEIILGLIGVFILMKI